MTSAGWICQACLRRASRPALRRLEPSLRRSSTLSNASDQKLSSALLSRARVHAAEHGELTAKLASSFDSASARRLGELTPVTDALKQYDHATSSLRELHDLLRDPSADAELRDLATEDIDSTESLVSSASTALISALVPKHPFADLPCLLEIRPGAGGSEAALFAGDLLRMYTALCQRRKLRAAVLKYEDAAGVSDPKSSDAPLQEAILEIDSPGAYDILRTEAGVHRVQRIPATESKGRTHTSAAAVLVLPSFGEDVAEDAADTSDPNSDFYVYAPDVRIETMRARGAGGQHVNTTDSAVRLTHIPTNTVVSMQDSRSQIQNRAKAWQILRARLAQVRREAREEERLKFRQSSSGHGKTGRGDKIRTYNWGQQRVTDHRSGMTLNKLNEVMDGGEALDEVMDGVRAWMTEVDLQDLLAEAEEARK